MPRTLPPVGYVEPMLPTLVDIPPEGDEWVRPSDLGMDRDNVNSLAFDIAREGIVLQGSIEDFFLP